MDIVAIPDRDGRDANARNPPPARILGTPPTPQPRTAEAGRAEGARGRAQILVEARHRRQETAHTDREQQAARRHLRTLCEDLDELLGQVGEVARRHHVEAAGPLLIDALTIAAELARRLPGGELQRSAATGHVALGALVEADVLRTEGLLCELDAELDRTARGEGTAQAPLLALAVLARIDALRRASTSGRTRS